MYKVVVRKNLRDKRQVRIRSKIKGTSAQPRLSVFRSNKYVYVQIIDDVKGKTLVSAQSEVKEAHKGKKKVDAAFYIGESIAKKALEKKIKKVVFDRGGYKYQGRVKSVAEGARKGGLEL